MTGSTGDQPVPPRAWIDSPWPEWLVVAASIVGWYLLAGVSAMALPFLSADIGGVYGALVALHGALLGFVLAALTIIMGYAGSPQLRLIRDAGQLSNLFGIFLAGVRSNTLAMVIALTALVLRGGNPLADILAWAVALTTGLALARLARTLWATKNVVARVGESLRRVR